MVAPRGQVDMPPSMERMTSVRCERTTPLDWPAVPLVKKIT